MIRKSLRWVLAACALLMTTPATAKTTEYNLTIARETVTVTGQPSEKITVNGTIPGPTLIFDEGDDAVVHVTNRMAEDTSVHWHGLLLPPNMDGVPGLGGFTGIKPGETFTYRFKIRQSGTYWYHAHSMTQEQDGHYGSMVIRPARIDPVKSDRDYVVLLSDFTPEKSGQIMKNLKSSADYYQTARPTVGEFFKSVRDKGLGAAWKETAEWGKMRMLPSDLSDVTGYTFLVNGKRPDQNWTGIFKTGERVRLRLINASAMTVFDVRIPGLKMELVAADGQNVEPVNIDEMRMGPAETYDVIVTPSDDKAYTIAAESIDRTGFALGTLAPREGMRGDIPAQRPRARLTMTDMNMELMMRDDPDMDMSNLPDSGWAQTGAPEGTKVLDYKDLRALTSQTDLRAPERTLELRLGGNMERYIWTLNGKTYADSDGPLLLKTGERLRLRFVNETMMAHPMHLHGMFMQLENGQDAAKVPNKHTVVVPPGATYSTLLTADEEGEWAFHCHLLYHMMSGMMTTVLVADQDIPVSQTAPEMDHSHHGHGGHHE